METNAGPSDNQLFGVEQHGIDYIPDSSRTGTYREIFGGFFGANVIFTYIVLGAVVGSLGLPLWQSTAVILAGNVAYILVGFTALAGPRAGTGTMTVSRAAFGIRGNRIPAALSWLTATGWTAVNLVIGTLACVTMFGTFGISDSLLLKAGCLVAVTLVTVSIALLGHATILRVNSILAVLLGLATALIAFYILPLVNVTAVNSTDQEPQWGALMLGFAIIGAAPMSYVNVGADYSRYMPTKASSAKIVTATALGGFIPAVIISVLGASAATVTDMTDPIAGLGNILPVAVFTVYIAVVVGGTITNNFLNTYSAGMSLLATGVRMRRTAAVAVTMILAFAASTYVVFFQDLTNSLTAFLTLMVIWSSAWCGIFLADMCIRRLNYDVTALHLNNSGAYWFRNGWNMRAMGWFLIGVVGSALTAQSPIFAGALVPYINNGDLSIPVGLVFSGVGYFCHSAILNKQSSPVTINV